MTGERISALEGIGENVPQEREREHGKDGKAPAGLERPGPEASAPPPPEREIKPEVSRKKAQEPEHLPSKSVSTWSLASDRGPLAHSRAARFSMSAIHRAGNHYYKKSLRSLSTSGLPNSLSGPARFQGMDDWIEPMRYTDTERVVLFDARQDTVNEYTGRHFDQET